MRINVMRQACCSADDQINRLDAVYEVDGSTTLEELLRRILSSDFLQYSPTHNQLSAEVAGRQIAEVTPSGISKWSLGILPAEPVATAVGRNTLQFSFRLNATGVVG
jgi:hypothetical protein